MSMARLASVLVALALAGCADPGPDHKYRAEIRWTTFGIPHIEGRDVPSVLFGQGYAHAQDHGCTVADQIVKVRSERSSFFGAGENDANLDSDFAHLALGIHEKAEAGFPEQPQEIQDAIIAYATGFNAYLAEHGEDLPCGGEPWLREIDAIDLFAHYIELGTLASGRQLSAYIATAQPPGSQLERDLPPISSLATPRVGSNGWAISSASTSTSAGRTRSAMASVSRSTTSSSSRAIRRATCTTARTGRWNRRRTRSTSRRTPAGWCRCRARCGAATTGR
jgi:acyl-homoserine-lactone acylase